MVGSIHFTRHMLMITSMLKFLSLLQLGEAYLVLISYSYTAMQTWDLVKDNNCFSLWGSIICQLLFHPTLLGICKIMRTSRGLHCWYLHVIIFSWEKGELTIGFGFKILHCQDALISLCSFVFHCASICIPFGLSLMLLFFFNHTYLGKWNEIYSC